MNPPKDTGAHKKGGLASLVAAFGAMAAGMRPAAPAAAPRDMAGFDTDNLFGLTQAELGDALVRSYYGDAADGVEGRARNRQDAYGDVYRQAPSAFTVIGAMHDRMDEYKNPRGSNGDIGGAAFIALRHNTTGQVVVAAAGLESDGKNSTLEGVGDALKDMSELAIYKMSRHTRALDHFVDRIQAATGAKPLLVSHSMATTAARAVSAARGLKSIEFEPRHPTAAQQRVVHARIAQLLGRPMSDDALFDHNRANCLTVTSDHPNFWNKAPKGQENNSDGAGRLSMNLRTGLKRSFSISDPGHRVDTAAAALAGYRDDMQVMLAPVITPAASPDLAPKADLGMDANRQTAQSLAQ